MANSSAEAASQDQDYTQQIGARGGQGELQVGCAICTGSESSLIYSHRLSRERTELCLSQEVLKPLERNISAVLKPMSSCSLAQSLRKGLRGSLKASSLPPTPMTVFMGRAEPRYTPHSNPSPASLAGAESCIQNGGDPNPQGFLQHKE